MPETSPLAPAEIDAERIEFEAVALALSRTPRLANLLRYLGEKYFSGNADQLTEYNIATEVFHRSKTTFDSSEDAIARVEAHRLRKRLKDFYDGPGKDHSLQLCISAGTYVPTFLRKAADPQAPPNPTPGELPASSTAPPEPPSRHSGLFAVISPRGPLRIGLVALLVLAVAGIASYIALHSRHATPAPATRQNTSPALPGASAASAPLPLRLLAGYTGAPQTDSAGAIWVADDQYVHGGGPWRRLDAPISRTSDPLLYQQWRKGDFSYDIPLKPGVYELHLYFVTADSSSEDLSTFTVRINGNPVLSGFDINSDALGENIADERIFRGVSPASDGMLHVSFNSERGAPQLNALEVLPGIPHKLLPIRLLMQRTSYTDHYGQLWHPDNYFMNGRLSDVRQQTTGASDPDLFTTERYGHFTYAIPVDPRDHYTLILHFAELYFGPQVPGGGGVGSRVFRVLCNGQTLLDNFDIYKEAGSLHVLTKTFYHIRPSAQGKLNLTFEPVINNATVSGIEVLDEGQ